MGAWKTTLIVVGAAAVGASASAAFWLLRTPRTERTPISAAAPQHDDEMATLKARLSLLESRAFNAVNTQHAAVPSTSAAREHDDPRNAEAVERERKVAHWMDDHYTTEVQGRVFGRYFADVDRVRAAESRDKAWGESVGRDLQKLLDESPGLNGTRIDKLECGSSLCRIHLEVDDGKRRGKLMQAIQSKLHFDEASAFIPAGERKMEAYFARQGATLPFFDQIKYVEEEMD